MAEEPKKRGKKNNLGETVYFQVSLPKQLHDYLQFLAQQSVAGVSETDIAGRILKNDLEHKLLNGYHKVDVPKPD